jgi:hypothetical protein
MLFVLTLLMKIMLIFVWMKFLRPRGDCDTGGIEEIQELKLGDAKAPQGNISGSLKHLSLGMPR